MGKLDGKVAVVTGAAFGNGRGIALRFADEGADVVIADIDAARMDETARMVCARGRRALVQRCDVSKKAEIDQLIAAAARELGHVDIAVANAGVFESDTDCLRMTEAQWDHTIGVNLKGVFFTLQAAANQMIAQGRGGRLIALASIMAEWGSAAAPAYSASKGGVKQLVKSFAIACGRYGITCNAIGPGF
ncbi:MAG TPA: SDR family NAD(P)-dependent oxidoreductase, partial [Candidatus Acidoferrales bacterium]|nr:SDR family NAD(P)-dependent oxidoreductase [Candidatus Acidoferrales bacterium]